MKKVFYFALVVIISLISCGETQEQKSPEELEKENQKKEIAAELNYGLGMADFGLYVSFMKSHIQQMSFVSEETRKLYSNNNTDEFKTATKGKESAKDKLNKTINVAPLSLYADSAQIYLDSIDYYEDFFNSELDKIYNSN